MGVKKLVKTALLGQPGMRPRVIKHGLLKGLKFNVDTQSQSMRLIGMDEREIAREAAELTAVAASAVDIGANNGWYSLYFASRPNIRQVYAFEPDPRLNQDFDANFALNDAAFRAKTTLVQKLCGNKDDAEWASLDKTIANLPRPIVLKIDVDGGEMDVFRGGIKTFEADGCLIVLETHSVELERQCQQFLNERGYQTRIITPGWYRAVLPEERPSEHNQWMIARHPG